jgi:four helix bundle protein
LPADLKFTIGGNFIRAAMSVANNIAEGSGKRSKNDKIRFYGYSLTSIRECIPPITVLFTEGQISEDERNGLRSDCVQIGNMLVGMMRSV